MSALEPRHLHEVDADERGVLLAENRRLAERCEQLEAALRGMVDKQGWVFPNGSGVDKCVYCEQVQTYSLEKSRYAPEQHAPDCPVPLVKALLGEDGHG